MTTRMMVVVVVVTPMRMMMRRNSSEPGTSEEGETCSDLDSEGPGTPASTPVRGCIP